MFIIVYQKLNGNLNVLDFENTIENSLIGKYSNHHKAFFQSLPSIRNSTSQDGPADTPDHFPKYQCVSMGGEGKKLFRQISHKCVNAIIWSEGKQNSFYYYYIHLHFLFSLFLRLCRLYLAELPYCEIRLFKFFVFVAFSSFIETKANNYYDIVKSKKRK